MAEARFRHSASTTASPPAVWDRLQDPATWAGVAGVDETSAHRHRDGQLVGFEFSTRIAGVSYRGKARVIAREVDASMTLEIRSNELNGTIMVSLAPASPGSSLDVTMEIRPAGIMGSMIFPVVSGAVSAGFSDSVEKLAARLGEPTRR